jgi:glutathione S-transferase
LLTESLLNDNRQICFVPQLILQKKGIEYSVVPISPMKSPKWIYHDHQSLFPIIKHVPTNYTLHGPLEIAEYLERLYPTPSLRESNYLDYREAINRSSGFWPAAYQYVTNKNESLEETYRNNLNIQMDILDEIKRSTPGPYLCGLKVTLADYYLLPKLFHAFCGIEQIKKEEFLNLDDDYHRPAIEEYMDKQFDMKEYHHKKIYYGIDLIVNSWKVERGERKALL